MRYTKAQAMAMAKSAPEYLTAKLPPGLVPWADLSKLRAMTGIEMDRKQAGEPSSDIEEFDEEVECRDGHKLRARIVRRRGLTTTKSPELPILVYFHGGGWVTGSYLQGIRTLRRLVKRLNLVAVALSYRLAPENPFPIPQHDAYDGLQWAVKNAKTWGANPETGLIVGGTSAGGQLASVCCLHWIQEQQRPAITGTYYDISWFMSEQHVPDKYRDFYNSPYQEEIKDSAMLKTGDIEIIESHLNADGKSDWYSVLSAPEFHEKMPPAYFQVSGQDPFRDHSLIYENILREASVDTRLDVYPGLFHAFAGILPAIPQTRKFLEDQLVGMKFLLKDKQLAKLS